MAFLGRYKKCDLKVLAEELGLEVNENQKIIELTRSIMKCDSFDEEIVKELIQGIVNERLEKEKQEKELEIKEKELKMKLESQKELKEKELEMHFELEKIRIQTQVSNGQNLATNLESAPNNSKVSHNLYNLMHKFNEREGDISLYLVLFERQATRLEIDQENWVTNLIGLLPYEISNLIAREQDENKANDYSHVKNLLLKRFKMSPEKFRHKFLTHERKLNGTWRDYAFEMTNYFKEWISGLEVTTFDNLKELMVTEQMKRKIPFEVKDHYVDVWSKIKSPNELADKLDDYEIVRGNKKILRINDDQNRRSSIKNKVNWRVENNIPNKVSKMDCGQKMSTETSNPPISSRTFNVTTKEGREPKCFNCNDYGHISKDCTKPKKVYICRKCGLSGHTARFCNLSDQVNKNTENSLTISTNKGMDSFTYLKYAVIMDNTISALVDTGSSSCLLRESVAKKLKLRVEPWTKRVYGFGNQNIPATLTVGKTSVNIEIDNVIGENIPVLVVKDNAQSYDLIIGRTWLDLPYVAYARVGEYLHIGYSDKEPFSAIKSILKESKIKFKASATTKIDRNTVHFINAETENYESGLVILNGTGDGIRKLVEVIDGKSVIPVSNYSDEEVILKKNQCVGRGQEIDIHELNSNNIELKTDSENLMLAVEEDDLKKRLITLDEIKTDKISYENKMELLKLLNEYRDCFALNISELGCTDLIAMEIQEIEGAKPVHMKPYRTNAEERLAIREIIREWKENGIVTETRSPYASPVMLVRKKTGENRLVIDYRRLNAQTIKDRYPLPRIDDLLEQLHDCKLFTTLDLAHGYLQIPLTDEAKLKTAFITPDETGQFERMIFGLTNAPAEFQRLMHSTLNGLINKEVLCYLDDILIPAKTWNEMKEKLTKVFEALRKARLTLKLPKCEFAKQEIEYLGFIINKNGIKPGNRKVETISKFPIPRNIHEIRRFLGLTSFFRRFVKNFAIKAEPLSRLTRKNEPFIWGKDQQIAFDKLKSELTKQPILALYQPKAPTEVHTDACKDGLAGMILQLGKDDKWHLVYCVSKKTTKTEQQYHSSKLELLAIIWTLNRLRQFLLGIEFTIVTDCQALIYMNSKKSSNPQISRWSNLIQEYNFSIRHRPGVKMAHIDAISRAPLTSSTDTLDTIIEDNLEVYITLTHDEQILMIQHGDTELKKLIEILKKEKHSRSEEENRAINGYILKKGRLYRVVEVDGKVKNLYVIPKCMRKSLVVKFHDLMGHFAVDRTISKIKELYWFSSMKRYVRRHISMCFECLVNKIPGGKKQGLLHPIKPGRRPFAIIHMDHLGPFVKSSKGNKELLVVIDNLTRFIRLYPTKDTSSNYVLKSLKSFVEDFGLPQRIISDRGSCFTSKQFEKYCTDNGISHTLNSTSFAQANGMVERSNRTIISAIAITIKENQKDWDKQLKEVERNLNNAVNKTIGKTPFEILHGYTPRFTDGLLRVLADEESEEWSDPTIVQEDIKNRIAEKQLKMKQYYDSKRSSTIHFEPGEIVVLRRKAQSSGEPTKVLPKYRGPMVVTKVLPSDTYRVSQLEERTDNRFYTTTAHVSQMKSWNCQHESDDDSSEQSDSEDADSTIKSRPRRNTQKPKRYPEL